jgi:hypothetical protein
MAYKIEVRPLAAICDNSQRTNQHAQGATPGSIDCSLIRGATRT